MGACGSAEKLSPEEERKRQQEKDKNKQVENTINADHHADQTVNKLLLLGAGESGKKQTKTKTIETTSKPQQPKCTWTRLTLDHPNSRHQRKKNAPIHSVD